MFRTTLIALIATATAALSGPLDGTQNHAVQQRFIEEPCSAVIAAINPTEPADNSEDVGEGMLIAMGEMAMTFGFLMGFEAVHPNIRGDFETVLQRLTSDCEKDSSRTAWHMLQGYAGN